MMELTIKTTVWVGNEEPERCIQDIEGTIGGPDPEEEKLIGSFKMLRILTSRVLNERESLHTAADDHSADALEYAEQLFDDYGNWSPEVVKLYDSDTPNEFDALVITDMEFISGFEHKASAVIKEIILSLGSGCGIVAIDSRSVPVVDKELGFAHLEDSHLYVYNTMFVVQPHLREPKKRSCRVH
jgi:hypothetical protein